MLHLCSVRHMMARCSLEITYLLHNISLFPMEPFSFTHLDRQNQHSLRRLECNVDGTGAIACKFALMSVPNMQRYLVT